MRIVFVLTFVVLLATLGDGVRADEDPSPTSAGRPRLVVQLGHSAVVSSAVFSPDGRHVLTASSDRTARLWETETGMELRRFEGHSESVYSAVFSPDGRHVLTASEDGTARLWEADTGREVRRYEGGSVVGIDCAAFSPDGGHVLAASADTALLLETYGGREVRRFVARSPIINFLNSTAFSPDGRYALAACDDGTARLWATETGKEVRRYEGHSEPVTSAVFSPDGKQILTASLDDTARLWEATTGREVRRFDGHSGPVNSAVFSPDGKRVLTASWDKTARLWEPETGKEVRRYEGNHGDVISATFSPDGRLVLTGDGVAARLWDTETGKEVRRFLGEVFSVNSAWFSPDALHILTACGDGTAWLWDTRTGRQVHRFSGRGLRIDSAAFSPDSRHALTASDDGTARLWDTGTGQEMCRFEGHSRPVLSAAFSPDGRRLLTLGRDETVRQWETETGKELRRYEGPHFSSERARGGAFSPDGRLVLTTDEFDSRGGWGKPRAGAALWESGTGKGVRGYMGHSQTVTFATFSPNSSFVLTASMDKTARLWHTETGVELRRFKGHMGAVLSAAFAPSDRHILTASVDRTARLWEAGAANEVRRFEGHTDWVHSAIFSPSGRHVLTASKDKTARLWETATGKALCSLITFRDRTWVVVSPRGHFDSGDLERIQGLHWVLPDEPVRTYPIDIFMRNYYEPRLMARLLAGETLPEVPDLTSLNRVQPAVRVAKAEPTTEGASTLRVTVEVEDVARTLPGRRKATHSGVEDLRLFRDGRLVAWKDGPLELKDGKATLAFEDVALWAEAGQKNVELSAYAFNVDRVKSETARTSVPLSAERPAATRTTYLIAMGVDVFDQPEWNLAYAAADARALLETLGKRFERVVPVLLTSERKGPRRASKKDLAAALAAVAKKAQPQDLVLITISTHGVSAQDGEFYLLPSDVAKRDDQGTWLTSCISAAELTQWLRPIDAEMVMVVDACQSAASVAKEGFKPGPMGSRGLGQLAYSKRMRILAASQAAEVALESGQIQHGLLTYALTTDGLEKGRADFAPKDGKVLLGEWLKYAERRVPTLAAEVHKGEVRAVARGGKVRREQTEPARLVQTPSLFDFAKRTTDVVLTGK